MLKFVLLSIPIYLMSCYKLPMHIIAKLNSVLNNFLHGSKLKWDSLDTLTTSRVYDSLGLRHLRLFKQTLLAKNGWKLLHDNKALCAKVLRAKYFSFSTFLDASKTSKASYLWSNLLWERELLHQGLG